MAENYVLHCRKAGLFAPLSVSVPNDEYAP